MERLVYIDTSLFIYLFENNLKYLSKVKKCIQLEIDNNSNIVSSSMVILELLRNEKVQKNQILLRHISSSYYSLPNLFTFDIDNEIAEYSAHISTKYNLSMPDAVHIGTAILTNCDEFFTNDKKLQKVKELKVTLLSEL